jgi:diguanylate cyclase (GGDEF)-like protein
MKESKFPAKTKMGLPNRAWFLNRLENILGTTSQPSHDNFAILYVDLDDFRHVNACLGRPIGNKLLQALALRLGQSIGLGHSLAYMGEDEFAVLLENAPDHADITWTAERIMQGLQRPFSVEGEEVFLQASMGIVHCKSSAGNRIRPRPCHLLQDLDMALSQAKSRGKGNYVLYQDSLRWDASHQRRLENDLRWAIHRREFCLFFQPIVHLATNTVTGLEALIRWRHPRENLISPQEFLPLAEKRGWIREIGDWVLLEACRQFADWKATIPQATSLTLSVNLSTKQLTADLPGRVEEILAETGLSGSDLKLEVTESTLLQDTQVARSVLENLRKLNVKICLDDFGTGYCSLNYLQGLPIDVLKVDRSFIQQIAQQGGKSAIVEAILTLAANLDLEVVAEGVERWQECHFLQQLGCAMGQGFLFSPPMNAGDTQRFLGRQTTFAGPHHWTWKEEAASLVFSTLER